MADNKDPSVTLYTAKIGERAAAPRERPRGRAAVRAEATSDVTRFRGVLAATVAGAGATLAAALILPPAGGTTSPGPLSRPHVRAKLECTTCHTGNNPKDDEATLRSGVLAVSSGSCRACHGQHGSLRRGHAAKLAAGA